MATSMKAREEAARIAKSKKRMRMLAIVGAVIVSLVAGWGSYWHGVEVAARYGGPMSWHEMIFVHLFSFAPDGLMIICAVAMISHPVRGFSDAKAGFWTGLVISLGVNVLAVQSPGVWAYVISGLPAILMMLGAHVLLRQFVPHAPKRRRTTASKVSEKAVQRTPARRPVEHAARAIRASAGI